MAFDYKKEYSQFYSPPKTPAIVTVPEMNFLAVCGKGDPNEEGGEYDRAVQLLYGVAYTIKMSHKSSYKIEGFFEYVVPPLEGLWWQEGVKGVDYSRKDSFSWISMIRLPDFVQKQDFEWAITEAARKKKMDFSPVQFFTYDEGTCVQCMHLGPYDDEPATVHMMEQYAKENGYAIDINDKRHHHEIYLSDPRKTDASKLKTIIRHPVRKL
jgi:hypothetical protein